MGVKWGRFIVDGQKWLKWTVKRKENLFIQIWGIRAGRVWYEWNSRVQKHFRWTAIPYKIQYRTVEILIEASSKNPNSKWFDLIQDHSVWFNFAFSSLKSRIAFLRRSGRKKWSWIKTWIKDRSILFWISAKCQHQTNFTWPRSKSFP